MARYLTIQIYGPLASWGDVAVGSERRSLSHPTHSSITGMIAAAFGIRRDEGQRLKEVAEGYAIASLLFSGPMMQPGGILLRDYHTAQVPSRSDTKGYPLQTRRDELSCGEVNTILSRREYRSDAYYQVAIFGLPNAPYSPEEIRQAFLQPQFVLYLGRKSCPLSLPLDPQIVEADSLGGAFKGRKQDGAPFGCQPHALFWDKRIANGPREEHTYTRRDMPTSRSKWLFAPRQEQYAQWKKETPCS